jgi:TRAP-type C4-dicarboxylate transport system permease small subunit
MAIGGTDQGSASVTVRAVRFLDSALKVPDLLASVLIGVALLVITGTLFVSAVGRYTIGQSLLGGEEAARYLMVWMTFLGTYVLIRKRSHIAIDILPRFAQPGVTRWLGVAVGALGAVLMFYLFWHGWSLAVRMLVGGQLSPVLPVPRGLLHLSMPVGAGLSVLAFVHMFLSFLLDPETELAKAKADELPIIPISEEES